jgi:hypothetical protein
VDDAVLHFDAVEVLLGAHHPIVLFIFLEPVNLVLPSAPTVFGFRCAAVDCCEALLVQEEVGLQVVYVYQAEVGGGGFHLCGGYAFFIYYGIGWNKWRRGGGGKYVNGKEILRLQIFCLPIPTPRLQNKTINFITLSASKSSPAILFDPISLLTFGGNIV